MTHYLPPSERDLELLSAYLDGELSDHERRAIEQRLASDSDLRRALDDLRATVRLVGALPRLKAPRSFALDPAIFGARIPWWRRWLASGAALQWSGALSAAASVVLIVLGVALSSGDAAPGREAAAPAQVESAAPAAAFLPTPQPSASAAAPFEAVPLTAGEAGADNEQALAGQSVEAPAAASGAILAAPQAAPPISPGDAAPSAAGFAEAGGSMLPATLSPDAALRSAPSIESFASPDQATDTDSATEHAEDRGAFSAIASPVAARSATPPMEQATVSAGIEAAGAENASPKAREESIRQPADHSGPRWWLIGAGMAGLALSAALYLSGRRQAGA